MNKTTSSTAHLGVLIVFLVIAGCGESVDEIEALGIELPRVGTLYEMPTGEGVIPVCVDGDGRITIQGKGPLSLRALRDELQRRTNDPTWREPDRSSRKILLIQADATVPWFVVQWLLLVGAEPTVGLYKINFGARPWKGPGRGALGVKLPKDRGINGGHFVEERPTLTVKLFAREGLEADADPEHLYDAMKTAWAGMENTPAVMVKIKTPRPYGAGVPAGFVVRAMDVAHRVGIHDLYMTSSPFPLASEDPNGDLPPTQGIVDDVDVMLAYVAAFKARNAKVKIRLGMDYMPMGQPGDAPLPPADARGLVSGAAPRLSVQPWDLDEEVPDYVETDEAMNGSPAVTSGPFTGPPNIGPIVLGGGAFRGREASNRATRTDARTRGGVEEALKWLAAHQSPDGGWEAAGFRMWCDGKPFENGPDGTGNALYDPGITGLALCAFLGAGYTNRGRHPFAKTVSKGLRRLKNVQYPDGCFGPRTHQHFIYNHATAALAMVEAYGMTGSPLFKSSAQKALDIIALARNPHWGWRYGVKPGDNDTSVTCWMVSVLASAKAINRDAASRGKPPPLTIDEEAFAGAMAWLEKMTDPDYGRVGYIVRGGDPARSQEILDRFPGERSASMTAAAIFARVLMGQDPRTSAVIQKGAGLCALLPPKWDPTGGHIDMHYWYWGSLALHQVGGAAWAEWGKDLQAVLLDHQHRDGDHCGLKGSWDPIGPWGTDGGRVYATAMLAMCLETPIRYERAFNSR